MASILALIALAVSIGFIAYVVTGVRKTRARQELSEDEIDEVFRHYQLLSVLLGPPAAYAQRRLIHIDLFEPLADEYQGPALAKAVLEEIQLQTRVEAVEYELVEEPELGGLGEFRARLSVVENRYVIAYHSSCLERLDTLVYVLAHEYAHALLHPFMLGHVGGSDEEERVTDLAVAYLGLGSIAANQSMTPAVEEVHSLKDIVEFARQGPGAIKRRGYLSHPRAVLNLAIFAALIDETEDVADTQHVLGKMALEKAWKIVERRRDAIEALRTLFDEPDLEGRVALIESYGVVDPELLAICLENRDLFANLVQAQSSLRRSRRAQKESKGRRRRKSTRSSESDR